MPKESGKLSDNWELVPRELGSGSSSPVLVRMSESTKASEVDPTSQLEAMKTGKFINIHVSQYLCNSSKLKRFFDDTTN
jgi:hypothetical protein